MASLVFALLLASLVFASARLRLVAGASLAGCGSGGSGGYGGYGYAGVHL